MYVGGVTHSVLIEVSFSMVADMLIYKTPPAWGNEKSFDTWKAKISLSTSNLIKRLHTARKKYTESHPKVLHLIEQTETDAEMDKADYEQSLASERSTGKLFKYFKAFHKPSLPSILKYKNAAADTDPLQAELFSKFFASVYIESCTFSEPPEPDSNTVLDTISFTELQILEICQSSNTNKNKGPDHLLPVMSLKHKHLYIILSIKYFLKLFKLGVFQTTGKQL